MANDSIHPGAVRLAPLTPSTNQPTNQPMGYKNATAIAQETVTEWLRVALELAGIEKSSVVSDVYIRLVELMMVVLVLADAIISIICLFVVDNDGY